MSKRFRFHLQPVLDLREGAEHRARVELAERMAVQAQGRQNLQTAQELVDEADASARERAAAPVTADQLAAQQLWRERLERYRHAAGEQLRSAEQDVVVGREALVDAHKKRATMDRLKEIRQEAHRVEMARREAAEADEIALRQHHARGRAA